MAYTLKDISAYRVVDTPDSEEGSKKGPLCNLAFSTHGVNVRTLDGSKSSIDYNVPSLHMINIEFNEKVRKFWLATEKYYFITISVDYREHLMSTPPAPMKFILESQDDYNLIKSSWPEWVEQSETNYKSKIIGQAERLFEQYKKFHDLKKEKTSTSSDSRKNRIVKDMCRILFSSRNADITTTPLLESIKERKGYEKVMQAYEDLFRARSEFYNLKNERPASSGISIKEKNRKKKREQNMIPEGKEKFIADIARELSYAYPDSGFLELKSMASEEYKRRGINDALKECSTKMKKVIYSPKEVYLTLEEQKIFLEKELQELNKCESLLKPKMRSAADSMLKLLVKLPKNYDKENHISKLNSILQEYKADLDEVEKTFEVHKKELKLLLQGKTAGIEGEKSLLEELKPFKNIMIILHNIRLVFEGESVENDAIVINDKGVYSIEVKNFGVSGKGLITVGKGGKWSRYAEDGSEIPMADPMHQVNRHIGYTQQLINSEIRKLYPKMQNSIYVQPIIVIGNDKITFENNSNLPILIASNVYNYILTHPTHNNLDQELQLKIKEILQKADKGSKAYPIPAYSEALKETILSIEENYKAIAKFLEKANHYGFNNIK